VTVANVDEAPLITSGGGGDTGSLTVTENATAAITVTSIDPEGAARTYSIAGADAALFAINAATGVLTFKAAPNFEAPADAGANNVYDVVVTASDGTLTDSQALAITVANVIDGVTRTGTKTGDTLTGMDAEDSLYGIGGNDTLSGNGGADLLDGGANNDTLTGGAGADRLTGGSGTDRFVYTSAAHSTVGAIDVITDFSRSDKDRISLTGVDADSNVAGDQTFAFIGSGGFTGVAGQLRSEQSGGNTMVFGDVNGDKLADFAIQLTGSVTLTAGDFLL
jgi:Ca2+-binding RTX toxin-like protein